MWKHIQYLQWKKTWRSQRMGTGIAARIFMGFFVFYFGAIFLALGMFFPEIAEETSEGVDTIFILHRYVFYYLLFELIMRVIFQEVSEVQFRQLSLLPINKSKIVHYILGGTGLSIFNLLPLVFIIPAAFSTIQPVYGWLAALLWLLSMVCLLLFNNYLALQIKHWVSSNPIYYLGLVGVVAGVFLVDYFEFLPLSVGFNELLKTVVQYYATVLLFAALSIGMYMLVFKRMLGQAYISGELKKSDSFFEKLNFDAIGDRGFFGLVAQLNLRLIFRNKRIRTQVIFGGLFLLYGLYLYSGDRYGPTFLLFWGLYMTGIIVLSFAQYIWSYQGDYFELVNTLPMPIKDYIRAQYNFLIVASVVTTVPSMLYYFMNPDIPKINLAAFFFNIGVNIPILLGAAVYNKKKLQTNTAGTFNMQGISGTQFLFIFVVLLLPIFIYLPFSFTGFQNTGLLVVGGLGLLGLLCRPLLIKGIAALFNEKKYGLTEGFRSN